MILGITAIIRQYLSLSLCLLSVYFYLFLLTSKPMLVIMYGSMLNQFLSYSKVPMIFFFHLESKI